MLGLPNRLAPIGGGRYFLPLCTRMRFEIEKGLNLNRPFEYVRLEMALDIDCQLTRGALSFLHLFPALVSHSYIVR